jgi:hypothetical protein
MGEDVEKLAAFKVTPNGEEAGRLKRPLLSDDDGSNIGSIGAKKAFPVCFELTNSDTTMQAELAALKKSTSEDGASEKQWKAFKYLMNFKDPGFRVNLFDEFPWMSKPVANAQNLPDCVVDLYKNLDGDQKRAYRELLTSLPCGVGILPGTYAQLLLPIGSF